MKQNTYIKIVNHGISNPVEGLLPFRSSTRVIPLPDNQNVEVRSGILTDENIIIFRDENDDIVNHIHTEHSVFIQEGPNTIGAFHAHVPLLMGTNDGLEFTTESYKDNPLVLPETFYQSASSDLAEIGERLVGHLNALPDEVIASIDSLDRFPAKTKADIGLEDAWIILFESIQKRYNLEICPITVSQSSGVEFIVFNFI